MTNQDKIKHAKAHLEVLKNFHPNTRAIEVITNLLDVIEQGKIYLLWRVHGNSSDRNLCGIFSTREKAEKRYEHENSYGHDPLTRWYIEERKVE